MAWEMGEDTRQVPGHWHVSTYKYKIDGGGLKLLADGMKDRKILGIRCPQCGTVYVPGPTFCRKCYVDIDEVVEAEDTGIVMSYAVEMANVRGEPLDEPRISAMIKLDGADTWMVGVIKNVTKDDMEVGMRVKAYWIDEPKGNLGDIDRFEPIRE